MLITLLIVLPLNIPRPEKSFWRYFQVPFDTSLDVHAEGPTYIDSQPSCRNADTSNGDVPLNHLADALGCEIEVRLEGMISSLPSFISRSMIVFQVDSG